MPVTFFVALGFLTAGDIAVRMKAEPKTVAEFYEAYKRYGLWLPPKDAKLVRWLENKVASGGSGLWLEKKIHLQLLLRERTHQSPAKVWDNGIEYTEHRLSRLVRVKPDGNVLKGLEWETADQWLSFAAVAFHLGWKELAEESFKRGRASHSGFGGVFPTKIESDPSYTLTVIRYKTWEDCYVQLLDAGTDRLQLYLRMKRVFDDDSLFRTEYHRDFLTDLDRTICSRQLRRIGTAGLIDQLTEIDCDPTRYYGEPTKTLSPFIELCRKGFSAFPEAIRSLKDPRLTRFYMIQGIDNGLWGHTSRIGTISRAWLVQLSDGEIDGNEEDGGRFQGSAEKWFADASKIGEAKWALQRIQPGRFGNGVLLHLLAAKYPENLAKLFLNQLHPLDGNLYGQIVSALIHAELPRERIVDLLTEAATHESIWIRESGLDGLRIVATNRMSALLQRHILKLNESNDIAHHSEYSDVRLIQWLDEFGDASAWAEYAQFQHRMTPQRRIENLERVGYGLRYPLTTKCRLKLDFLRRSWDDTSIRIQKSQNQSLSCAYQYPQIAVGDFVTLSIAGYLDIDIPWSMNRSPSEWAAIRKKVERKLEDVISR